MTIDLGCIQPMIHAPVYFLEGYIAMEASRFTRVLPVRWPFLAAGFATMIAFSPAKSFALDSSATASTTAPIAYLPETALAYADMPTKAIPMKVPPITGPVPCTDLSGFVATDCVLSRYGITVYGTIDVGGGYQTQHRGISTIPPGMLISSGRWGDIPCGLSRPTP